jgi:hypothetical protein
VALALIAACFVAAGVARISLFIVLPVTLGISLICARRGWL